jgi:hypothetical protein
VIPRPRFTQAQKPVPSRHKERSGIVASAEGHYEKLLAQHYTWMRGNFDAKVREYGKVLEGLGLSTDRGGKALYLGAGSGIRTVALADLGFRVVSLDSSEALLRELRGRTSGHEVRTVLADMRDAEAYAAEGPFEVAVCMGDADPPGPFRRGTGPGRRRVRCSGRGRKVGPGVPRLHSGPPGR